MQIEIFRYAQYDKENPVIMGNDIISPPLRRGLGGWVSLREFAFLSLQVFVATLPKATKI
ncbi:hypothetical protein [Helicobacter sp. T3_23-1059]